jgi:hypothetical protein
LSLEYEAQSDGKPADPAKLVALIASRGSNAGVRYESSQTGERRFHIAPVARRNVEGQMERYAAPLDEKISMPPFSGNGYDFVHAFAATVSEVHGRPVVIGTIALNRLYQTKLGLAAIRDDIARDVFDAVMLQADPSLTWQVLCQPGEECFINIYFVARPSIVSEPTTGRMKRNVLPPGKSALRSRIDAAAK